MGKKSTKENKNIYQECRENAGLTREAAAEIMQYVSADSIEKIENERKMARPEEILAMSDCYNKPELCNYYCTHECAIGKKYSNEVRVNQLSQIVLETLDSLEKLNNERKRLVEITVDGEITEDEAEDFEKIQDNLEKLSTTVGALKFWTEKASKTKKKKQ